jgi:PhnB protein
MQAYQAGRTQAGLAQTGVATLRAEARDDVYAVIHAWTEALRKKDATAAVDCYGPEVRMFTLAPPLEAEGGREAGIENLEGWFATWHEDIGYELAELQVTANEDIAFAHGLAHLTGTKTDSDRVDLWFRETLCFRRIADEWKITHEHSSVPFHMDGSGRAALDLEPGSPQLTTIPVPTS